MASKAAQKVAAPVGKITKSVKKGSAKAIYSPFLKVNIPAGQAKAAPPLGPQLGQRGITIAQFCKDFNAKTAHIKDGYPIPTGIHINMDKTFLIELHTPATSFLLRKAAGAPKGAMHPGKEIAGMISVKHVYEIAKVKSQDPSLDGVPLKRICDSIIGQALSLGIKVMQHLGEEQYREFLDKRKLEIEEQNKMIEEKKAAKMLRL